MRKAERRAFRHAEVALLRAVTATANAAVDAALVDVDADYTDRYADAADHFASAWHRLHHGVVMGAETEADGE